MARKYAGLLLVLVVVLLGLLSLAVVVAYSLQQANEELRSENTVMRDKTYHLEGQGLVWNWQVSHSVPMEPTTTAGPGLHLAEIRSVDPETLETTVDWVGGAINRNATNARDYEETLLPVNETQIAVVVQEEGYTDIPREVPIDEFFADIAAGSEQGQAYLESRWWISVFSEGRYSVLMEAVDYLP